MQALHIASSFMFRSIIGFRALLFFSAVLQAAEPKEALLIANGKYSHFAGLAHPGPDADKLGAALEQLGFRVHLVRDGNREQMLDAIAEFERGLSNTGAIAFFHYGGHGVQVDGKNYLLPADADVPDERRVATRTVALDEVMTAMDAAAARASIIVIDACRDNPLPSGAGRNLARGLSVVGLKPKNSIVIYSAEAGSKALDGLFTPILAKALQQKGRTIDQVMKSVRSEVYAKSSGQQTPGEYNQLFEDLFLNESASEDIPLRVTYAPTPEQTPFPLAKPSTEVNNDKAKAEGRMIPDASDFPEKSVKSFVVEKKTSQASTQKKPVLLEFTGSDWCPPCIKQNKDVFEQPAFEKFAKDKLVLVKLDFPRSKPQAPEIKKRNQQLAEQYEVEGFPTVILLGPDGKELAREVGYKGGGLPGFINWVNTKLK
jgi:thiol-disulfide isomerase/thioredoxin